VTLQDIVVVSSSRIEMPMIMVFSSWLLKNLQWSY